MRANRGVAILMSRACKAIPRPTLHANVFTQLFGRCRPISRQPLPLSQSDAEPSRSNPTVLPNGMYEKLPHTRRCHKHALFLRLFVDDECYRECLLKNSIARKCSEKLALGCPTNDDLNFLDIFCPWILARFRRNRTFSTDTRFITNHRRVLFFQQPHRLKGTHDCVEVPGLMRSLDDRQQKWVNRRDRRSTEGGYATRGRIYVETSNCVEIDGPIRRIHELS